MTISLQIITSKDGLLALRPSWRDLAQQASEPNLFYEADQIIAAASAFSPVNVRHLFFWQSKETNKELIGYVPITLKLHRYAPGQAILQNWRHHHCYLGIPLVARGFEHSFCRAFLEETAKIVNKGAYLRLTAMPMKSRLFTAFCTEARRLKRPRTLAKVHGRSFITCIHSYIDHLQNAVGKNTRKGLRRAASKLNATGDVRYERLATDGDLIAWFGEFSAIEAVGWKGYTGTAIGATSDDRRYFINSLQPAQQDGRLVFLRLKRNGQTLAASYSVAAATGHAFALKTTYDEQFSELRPGVLLEAEYLRLALDELGAPWVDSCADGGNATVDSLWRSSRRYATVAVSHGGLLSNALVQLESIRRLRWKVASGKTGACQK